MLDFFKRVFKFIREYPGILYSLFLIFFIPLSLYYYTVFTTKSFQRNIDYNLQTKALILENILSNFLVDFFDKPEILDEKIKEITRENPEITNLRVIEEEKDGEFKIVSSQNPEEKGKIIQEPSLGLSWSQNQTISSLINQKGERFWKVTKPIIKEGEKLGLISMALSLKEADLLIKKTIYYSSFLVLVIVVLSLFLIIHHTRLFGYVALTKKLQELDKMKDEFVRMATHELQSPITNIRGYILSLEEEIKDFLTENQKEYLRRTNLSAKNLSDLISDILEVSRIEQGRLDFTPQRIYPPSLIKEIVKEFEFQAKQKNLYLDLTLDERPYLIEINPYRFREILTNLLENSIKYTFKGRISLETKIDENKKRYLIEIKDTGLGITAENQTRLFEKFYRVKTKEIADIPGTGLGLWITKQLVENSRGKIFLESMEKIGTKITIIFPLIKG